MTRTNPASPAFSRLPRTHGLKDVAVVAFLVVVLGAFVGQLVRAPSPDAAQTVSLASR